MRLLGQGVSFKRDAEGEGWKLYGVEGMEGARLAVGAERGPFASHLLENLGGAFEQTGFAALKGGKTYLFLYPHPVRGCKGAKRRFSDPLEFDKQQQKRPPLRLVITAEGEL